MSGLLFLFNHNLRYFSTIYQKNIISSQFIIAKSSFEELQRERFKKVTDYYIEFIEKYPNSAFIKELEKNK